MCSAAGQLGPQRVALQGQFVGAGQRGCRLIVLVGAFHWLRLRAFAAATLPIAALDCGQDFGEEICLRRPPPRLWVQRTEIRRISGRRQVFDQDRQLRPG